MSDEDLPEPVAKRRIHFSVIWIVPLVAALVAGWLLYAKWKERGELIVIQFEDASGVEVGQTLLQHRGVTLGVVETVSLGEELAKVELGARLRSSANGVAREQTQFWIVQPEFGAAGVRGLNTIISGVHIGLKPGGGEPANRFVGLSRPPAAEATGTGKAFYLEMESLNGIEPMAPVLYKDVKVGVVETSRLSDDAQRVLLRIRIFNPYTNLVRTDSVFWNASRSPFDISLFGGKADTLSLQSIVTGAIGLGTPENYGELADEHALYPLNPKGEKDWRRWKPSIPIEPDEARPQAPSAPSSPLPAGSSG